MAVYKVVKPFVFRGLKFEPGQDFDPVTVFCDTAKLRALEGARYIASPNQVANTGTQVEKVVQVAEKPATEEEKKTTNTIRKKRVSAS